MRNREQGITGVRMALTVGVAVVASTACGSESPREIEGVSTDSAGLDFSYTAPTNIPTTSTNPFAGTPTAPHAGSGYFNYSGVSNGDIYACRDCSYTSAADLASSLRGQEQSRNLNTSVSAALGAYSGTLWSYGTNGGLAGRMAAAQSHVSDAFAPGSYASELFKTIDNIKSLMEMFPNASGKVQVSKPPPTTWAIGFKPIQARARTAVSRQGVFNWQPTLLRQTRFRGARSYCAMREAAREQRDTNDTLISLGEQTVGSWWLWDYGTGESTVKVAGPIQVGRVPGQTQVTSTGANAYVIPIAIGAQVTPLYGPLFPRFPEVVHPMVWVTGDSEVLSQEGGNQYVNTQHADFWAGQYVEGAGITTDEILLFSWGGVVNLFGMVEMGMTMGKPVDGLCGSAPFHSNLGDGRGLYFPPPEAPFPNRRTRASTSRDCSSGPTSGIPWLARTNDRVRTLRMRPTTPAERTRSISLPTRTMVCIRRGAPCFPSRGG